MSPQTRETPKRQLDAGQHAPASGSEDAGGGVPDPLAPSARAKARAEDGTAVRRRPSNFAEEVKRNIRSNLANPNLSADAVAKLHDIDRRTLSRRLSAEGTSFSELHRSLRYERACTLLCETTAPLSAITAALGYSEQSAFNRAFQIWTGTSPKRFRSS